jgi:hypothetical protein
MVKYKPTKAELISQYSRYEPQFFTEYIGFLNFASSGLPAKFHDLAIEDKDGHLLFSGDTYELGCGFLGVGSSDGPALRLLIKEGTTKEEVVVLLDKIKAWIEKDGLPF